MMPRRRPPRLVPGVLLASLAPVTRAASAEPLGVATALQVLVSLGVVLALLVGLVALVRRLQGLHGVGQGSLRVLEVVALGARDRVVLLEVGGDRVLIGASPGRLATLHVLPGRGPVPGEGFADRLAHSRDAVRAAVEAER